MIIDAHAHIMAEVRGIRLGQISTRSVGLGRVRVGDRVEQWMPPSFERSAASLDVLIRYLDWVGIDGAVLLQAPCYGDHLEYLYEAVAAHPHRFVTVGLVDPRDVQSAPDQVRALLDHAGIVGVKFEVPDTPFDMDHSDHESLWRAIDDAGLLVVVDLGWHAGPFDGQVDRLARVLRRHPALEVVVAHLGVSRLWDPAQRAPFPEMQHTLRQLLAFPAVTFDLAALPFFCPHEEYPYPRAQAILEVALDIAGPSRLMWGSDFPTVLQHCTYRQTLDLVRMHMNQFDQDAVSAVLGGNARRVYRFGRALNGASAVFHKGGDIPIETVGRDPNTAG